MNVRVLLLTVALALSCAAPGAAQAVVKQIDYKGWNGCYELSNPLVRVVVVPQIGGRIMEYSIRGENVIWQNKAELGVEKPSDLGKQWHNYGGYKAWNAPQARWRSPDNDNFYDYAPASVQILPRSSPADMMGVRITTRPIAHLGFRFVREVYLAESTSRVRLVETMRNISDRDIEWSVWDVTQVNAPCWIAFPIDAGSKFRTGWKVLHPENQDAKQVSRLGNLGIVRYEGLVEKIGTDSAAGWMVYFKDRLGYVKQWSVRTVGAAYPDDGCNAEVFTADKAMGGYVEMEVLGPIVKLKPGEESTLTEDWFLTRLNQSAKDTADIKERLKLLQKRGLLPRRAVL